MQRGRSDMARTSRVRRKRAAPPGTSRAKGDIVEEIIAIMHETDGVRVERNVFLPTEDAGRDREIDVLLTSNVAGYPVRIAIECKNEDRVTGVGAIDEFIGKLRDIHIPLQHGIFVAAKGYTKGAIKRARREGIRPLVLRAATSDLPDAIQGAFQSLIYVLAQVERFRVTNDVPSVRKTSEVLQFRDSAGQLVGSLADLIWDSWRSGRIPTRVGVHEVDLSLPEGWMQIVDGRVARVSALQATVRVTAAVITIPGKLRRMSLLDPSSLKIERERVEATFEHGSEPVPVTWFSTENELEQSRHVKGALDVTLGRMRIPRIVWEGLFWPPSKRSLKKWITLLENIENGTIPDPRPFGISDIEGDDLSAAWAEPWEENPFLGRAPSGQDDSTS